MHPETEKMLGIVLYRFCERGLGSQGIPDFIHSIKAIEEDWRQHLYRMKEHLPGDLRNTVYLLTAAESLLTRSDLLETVSGALRLNKFKLYEILVSKLDEGMLVSMRDTPWSHIKLLAVCRLTEDDLEQHRKMLEELSTAPGD